MLQLKLCDEFLKIKHHFFWHSPQTLYFDDSSLFSNVSCILCIFWCLLNFFSNKNLLRKHCNLVIMMFHCFSQKFFLTFSECSPIWWLLNLILSYFHMHSNSGFVIFHHFYCTWCFRNFFLRKKYFFASTATSCFSLYSWLKIICYISCMIWHLMSYKILKLKNRF